MAFTLELLKKENETRTTCAACNKPLTDINLTFKVVKGCPPCEEKLCSGKSLTDDGSKNMANEDLLARLQKLVEDLSASGYSVTPIWDRAWATDNTMMFGQSLYIKKNSPTSPGKTTRKVRTKCFSNKVPLWTDKRDGRDGFIGFFWETGLLNSYTRKPDSEQV